MQRLDEIVTHYLDMDTSYALMITGEWGTGKTYYFKNNLSNKISNVPVYNDATKKYKPLIISLFGLKSIEEIQTQILLSIFPLLKNKAVKLGLSITKSLTKAILQFKNLENIYDRVSEIKVEKGDWINFEELVLCFDDLERISKQLSIEELIGYINSLVENENVKIIIIANEDKLDKDSYGLLKEKVIGNTIVFIPVFGEIYDNIVKTKFSGSLVYKEFLEANKGYILPLFIDRSSNLRILIFALSYFQIIFSYVNKNLFNEDSLKEDKNQILLNLLKFTLSISIEYKLEKINYKSRNGIDNVKALSVMELMAQFGNRDSSNKEKAPKEKKYAETFLEVYYKKDSYIFYETVYDYLTGGASLNEEELITEISQKFHIEKKVILPQYEIFSKLNYPNCFSLTDKEYSELTRKMLHYAYAGKYDLITCFSTFHCAARFNNPLYLDLNILEKKLAKGMMKSKSSLEPNGMLGHQISYSENHGHTNHLKALRAVALKVNEEIQQKIKVEETNQLEKLCYQDFEKFYPQVLDGNQSAYHEPIFSKFSPTKFYSFFLNNPKKWEISSFFRSRNNGSYNHKEELHFYKTLLEKVSKKNAKIKGKNVSGFVWSEFERVLREQLTRIRA